MPRKKKIQEVQPPTPEPSKEEKVAAERRNVEKTLNLYGVGRYNTLDESKYKNYLDSLGITDLQDEAMKRGLKPIAERPFMTETLLGLFRDYARQFIPMPEGQTGVAKGKEHKLQEMLRICRQGR